MAIMIPGDIKRKLKNPGERAKISDADLKKYAPDQYAKRAANKKAALLNATLYNPTAPLSGRDLRDAARSLAGLEVAPQMTALSQEEQAARSQAGTASDALQQTYSKYLAPAYAGSAAASGAVGQQLAAQFGQQRQQEMTRIDQAEQAAIAGLDPRQRELGQEAKLRQEFALQRQRYEEVVGQQQLVAQTAQAGSQGQAAAQMSAGPAAVQQGQVVLAGNLQKQLADIGIRRSAIQGQEGELFTKNLLNLRNEQFQNIATAKGLDINMAQLAETQRSNQAQESLAAGALQTKEEQAVADRKKYLTDLKYKYDALTSRERVAAARLEQQAHEGKLNRQQQRELAQLRAKGKAGGGEASPTGQPWVSQAQQTNYGEDFDRLRHSIAKMVHDGLSRSQMVNEIRTFSYTPPDAIISAALDAEGVTAQGKVNKSRKGLSKGTVHKLHQRGIKVGPLGVPTLASGPTYTGAPPNLPQ